MNQGIIQAIFWFHLTLQYCFAFSIPMHQTKFWRAICKFCSTACLDNMRLHTFSSPWTTADVWAGACVRSPVSKNLPWTHAMQQQKPVKLASARYRPKTPIFFRHINIISTSLKKVNPSQSSKTNTRRNYQSRQIPFTWRFLELF